MKATRRIGTAILLCVAAGFAQGQAANFRIAGRVVSALDGRALDHATVSIETVPGGTVTSRTRVASLVTGPSGEFLFEHLPAGKYTLSGEASGFLAASLDQHEQFSTAVVTGVAGVDTEHLGLRLRPAAEVSGRVLDEAGDPVRMARVTLYRETHGTGKTVVLPAKSAQTDDRGEYAMGALSEGRYFVSVRATPWYATHPDSLNNGGGSPVVSGVDPALDVAYPLTFYPDVTDWHEAGAVELKGGGETRVDLHLAPVRAAKLTIHKGAGEEQIGLPELRVRVFDSYEPVLSQGRGGGADSMDVVGLPPGQYTLRQHRPRTGGVSWTGAVDLRNGPVELESGTAAAAGSLKVAVEEAGGGKLPAKVQVFLRGGERGDVNAETLNGKGEATLGDVPAGEYSVVVFGGNRNYLVTRVEVKGKAAVRDKVAIASGEAAEARVVVAGAPLVSVEGAARRDGKPAAGAMIVLVPVDDTQDAGLFRRDQSDLDGTFVLPQVLPGRYIAVAIEDGWKLEWGKAAVLSPYLLKGVAVEVGAGGARTMKLPETLVVQPR